mgnify:CR=1 FL=1
MRPDEYPAPGLIAQGLPGSPTSTRLYAPAGSGIRWRRVDINLRPYATWANGNAGPMTVFFYDATRSEVSQ